MGGRANVTFSFNVTVTSQVTVTFRWGLTKHLARINNVLIDRLVSQLLEGRKIMFVLLLVTIVGSVLITWLLPQAFHSEPPYSTAVDIGVGTVAALIWAVLAYQVVGPLIGLEGWLLLAMSALDAIGLAAVMLWVLRRVHA